jgi:ankyrin repeat protein
LILEDFHNARKYAAEIALKVLSTSNRTSSSQGRSRYAARWLLKRGAKHNACTKSSLGVQHSALSFAVLVPGGLELLLEYGVELNFRFEGGLTLLAYAVKNRNLFAVEKLLSKGVDPNIYDDSGALPVHMQHIITTERKY